MFQFPASPTVGQSFTPIAGVTYRWNGTAWYLVTGVFLSQQDVQNIQNRIINGNFAIDQRNAGAAVTCNSATAAFGPDRWSGVGLTGGAFTLQREADALYPGEYRLKIAVTVADAALGGGDFYLLSQRIEGVHAANLNGGSANAQQMTLAFEVESTIAGTFPISFRNSANNRSYVTTFTVNAPNVREAKTITLTADTAGVWLADNGIGVSITFNLGTDPVFNAAANAWTAGGFYGVAGSTNFMATVGNTMRLKNVRLYKGAADLGPDQRLFAAELELCQRYYEKSYDLASIPGAVTDNGATQFRYTVTATGNVLSIPLAVRKRAAPSVVFHSTVTGAAGFWRNTTSGADLAVALTQAGEGNIVAGASGAASADIIRGHWTASAEL